MTSLSGSKTGMKKLRKLTEEQLSTWGVKYHELMMEKLPYDLWIDDKAVNPDDHAFNLLHKEIRSKIQ